MLSESSATAPMDPANEAAAVPQSRNAAFSQGQGGIPTAQDNAPRTYTNSSVLGNPDIQSPNGMAMGPTGSDRRLYGTRKLLPTFLGTANSTRDALLTQGIATTTRNA